MSVQVFKCSSVQVFKCSSVQVFKCSKLHEYMNTRIPKHTIIVVRPKKLYNRNPSKYYIIMAQPIRVLVVGCGNMGASHARAYHKMDEFKIAGLVSRGEESRQKLSDELGGGMPIFSDFYEALKETQPDAVSVNTYPDTLAEYVIASLKAGAHVFVEKPLANTVEECEEIVRIANETSKKLLIGYIVRVHPAWTKFIEISQTLGKPLVMRMNLNQQSSGKTWETHKNLMKSMSPIVDCGVHYVDVMCLMTKANPIRVSGIGARLTN